MRKFLLAATASIALASPAFAADMPVKALAPVAALPSWTGIYAGLNAGYAWGDVDWLYAGLVPAQRVSANPTGLLAGAHIGAQYQWSQLVFGAEASWSGGSKFDSEQLDAPVYAPVYNTIVQIKDLFTAGGRLGWAFGAFNTNLMVYGTGGYAQSSVATGYFVRNGGGGPFGARGTDAQTGWFWGVGVEALLTNNFYVGLEYKHVDIDTGRQTGAANPNLLLVGNTRFVDTSFDSVQFRVGVKLP